MIALKIQKQFNMVTIKLKLKNMQKNNILCDIIFQKLDIARTKGGDKND